MNRRRFFYNVMCFAGGALFSRTLEASESLGTILYAEQDGLWLRELPGGTPRLLAGGTNISKPRFSPSGKWISYFNADRLCVLSLETGRGHFLGTAGDADDPGAQWSPQHDELALEAKNGVSLFSAENQWKETVRTIDDAALPLLFSPDGSEVVFGDEFDQGKPKDADLSRFGRICRLSLRDDKLKRRILIAESDNNLLPFAWNRRRGEIYYWRDLEFSSSIRADGLDLIAVSDQGGAARSLGFATLVDDDMISLSPAQDQLVACAGGGRNTWEQKRILLANLRTGTIRYITENSVAAVTPRWSPAGNRIVYAAAPTGDASGGEDARVLMAQRRLWSVAPDADSPPQQLTHDSLYRDEEPLWSADGSQILFGRITRNGDKSLWLMKADGSNPRQVTGTLPICDAAVGASYRQEESWWGYYGYIDWTHAFDWRQ